MREFFKGWRRKVGCVALVMACACMASWMRGYLIRDEYMFGSGKERVVYRLVSSAGGLRLSWDVSEMVTFYERGWTPRPSRFYGPDILAEYAQPYQCSWRWSWYGFDIGEASDATGDRIRFALIPYWSLVLPLTLLSAYLILWKPRNRGRASANLAG